MKKRLLGVFIVIIFLLILSFSLGNNIYLFMAILLSLGVIYSFLSVYLSIKNARVIHELDSRAVTRGEQAEITVSVDIRSILPIAPVKVFLRIGIDRDEVVLKLNSSSKSTQYFVYKINTDHVGVLHPGVTSYVVEDIFSLISLRFDPDVLPLELVVLPLTFEVEPLKFSPGDTGLETLAKAREDASNPADIRSYQSGDSLKKIHWKVSMRSKEIMVRRFEEPDLPDVLVLVDSSMPQAHLNEGTADIRPFLRDTICETAASIVASQNNTDHPVRVPLVGLAKNYDKSMGLEVLLESLARLSFDHKEPFEKILNMEVGLMRKSGATAIITSKLTWEMVDIIGRIHKIGPYVRLYLATILPEREEDAYFVSMLQQSGVDVCFVSPSL